MIKLIAGTSAVLAAAAFAVVMGTEASSAALVATCHSRNLRPVFGGREGTAGTLHDHWRLVNVGTSQCSVTGFPTVHNYRADGRPLPTSVTQSGTPGPVTLQPGQHASFILSYPEPGNLGCTPQPAARMTIQPSISELVLITNRGERSCHGQLDETPLVHGG
jgi:Protein of unknown function (DUF4232)